MALHTDELFVLEGKRWGRWFTLSRPLTKNDVDKFHAASTFMYHDMEFRVIPKETK